MTERASHAGSERHVSLRPAPDTMTYLTALLPVADGVAVLATLCRYADGLRSDGDTRSRGHIMADALVERATGIRGGVSGVEIQLVMTDRTVFQGACERARMAGYGIVPAGWARSFISAGTGSSPTVLRTWIRRLYSAPSTGELIAMDSRARLFPTSLRRFIGPGTTPAAPNHTKEIPGWNAVPRLGPHDPTSHPHGTQLSLNRSHDAWNRRQ